MSTYLFWRRIIVIACLVVYYPFIFSLFILDEIQIRNEKNFMLTLTHTQISAAKTTTMKESLTKWIKTRRFAVRFIRIWYATISVANITQPLSMITILQIVN